jgi:subtilase family serine protease
MNNKAGGTPGPRRTAALAAVTAATVLVTACGAGSSSASGPAATGSATYRAELAYAHCMQTHGVPSFPDPVPSGNISIHGQPHGNSPAARANSACEHLLAAASTGPASTGPASPAGSAATDCLAARPPCYTPQQLEVAYGVQPLLDRGIDGRGQTIVLPEFPPAGGSPSGSQGPAVTDIRSDLARFDAMFHLPAAQLQVVNTLAHAASPWLAAGEEVEDTEIVHAIAPDAAIREILIPSPATASPDTAAMAVAAALRVGLTQGSVISLSAGEGEQCFGSAAAAQLNAVLQAAQRDRVTVVVATSDDGAATACAASGPGSTPVKGVDLPSSDPLALAVGGTSLRARQPAGAYLGETAWNVPGGSGSRASGGGFSRLYPRPAYQDGIAGIGATRGVPDVAADADPDTGMALAFSGSQDYVIAAGGTSAATPLWAAVIALADQYADRDLGFVNSAIYQIGRGAYYHRAFHDVATGTNTVQFPTGTVTGYQAGPGWDPVTGWGSPDAQVLVPLLARYAHP